MRAMIAIHARLPAIDPDMEPPGLGARFPQRRAADLLGVEESLCLKIRDRSMREIELTDRPARSWRLHARRHGPTEKSQLESELAAVGRTQMAGVIPPFGPKAIVRSMVAGERVPIARFRVEKRPLDRSGRRDNREERDAEQRCDCKTHAHGRGL